MRLVIVTGMSGAGRTDSLEGAGRCRLFLRGQSAGSFYR